MKKIYAALAAVFVLLTALMIIYRITNPPQNVPTADYTRVKAESLLHNYRQAAEDSGEEVTGNPADHSVIYAVMVEAPLDLGGADLTLAAMPDFVNGLTNSAASRCVLTVPADGRLDFTGLSVGGLEKVDLVVQAGGQVDLGGETVTVRRYTGAPEEIVNGTLVELKPLRGLFLMVR